MAYFVETCIDGKRQLVYNSKDNFILKNGDYYGIKGNSLEDADAKSEKLGEEVLSMIHAML